MRAFLSSLMVAAGIWLAIAPTAGASEPLEDFAEARKAVQQQLRSKKQGDRIEALHTLGKYPLAESVRLIHHSLEDKTPEVRDAAYETLLAMNGSQEACEALQLMAKKALQRKDEGAGAAPLLAVLLSSELPVARRDVNDLLERACETRRPGVQVVLTLADELGAHGSRQNVLPLVRLSESKMFKQYFALRRAVVAALTKIKHAEAIAALIEITAKIRGEAQIDAVEHLTLVTGQVFGVDGAAWKRWWETVGETYVFPTKYDPKSPYRSLTKKFSSESFYGLPVFADRLVFVLDTSGSMAGAKIDAAKRELIRAVKGLPDRAYFSIVVFNGPVHVWQKELVPATTKNQQAAIEYVNAQGLGSNTASYDALDAAFAFDTEAIYFLSDGAPNGGKISSPVDIVNVVTAANRSRRLSIYTIGVDVGLAGGPLEVFLKTLAEQNLGLFTRVDY